MRQLKADLSAIAMSVLTKPEIKVASFLSLDHKDNVRILLDASTVSQILKLRRTSFLDVVAVQLTEQNHRASAILSQSFKGLGRLGYLLIERLRPVKAEQSEIVDEDYSALTFRLHGVNLRHHIADRLGRVIDIDREIAQLGNTLFEDTPIIDLDLWLRKNRHGYGGEVCLELTHDNLYSNFKSRGE